MNWFPPLVALLVLACAGTWLWESRWFHRFVADVRMRCRGWPRSKVFFMLALLIWAVAHGGGKDEEQSQGGGQEPPEDEMAVVPDEQSDLQTFQMQSGGPLWSTFQYPSWPFDAFTSDAIAGMVATNYPPIPDVMLASGLALYRVTTNATCVDNTNSVAIRAWAQHGADNRGVWVDTPFPVVLGTNSYTDVGILANGRLAFGYATYHRQPTAGLPFATPYPVVIVAPLWGPFSLLPSAGSIAWTRTITSNRFVVCWENLLLNGDPALPATVQCEINRDGTMQFLYGTLAEGVAETSTVGVQNLGHGWTYSHGQTNRLAAGMAVSLRPVGLDGWAEADPDGDLLSSFDEFMLGTDPVLADTDGDGPSDLWELNHGYDPLVAQLAPPDPDTDGDGIPDRWEVWMSSSTNDPAFGRHLCIDDDGDGFVTWYEWYVLESYTENPLSPGPPEETQTDILAVIDSNRPCVLRLVGNGQAVEIPWMPGVSTNCIRLRLVRGQEYETVLSRVPLSTNFTTEGFWWANLAFVSPDQATSTPVVTNGMVNYNAGTVHITAPDLAGETWLVPGVAASPTNHVDTWRIAVDWPLDFCHESYEGDIPLTSNSLVMGDIQWSGLASTNLYGRPLLFNPSQIAPGSHTVTARSVVNNLVSNVFEVNILYVGVATNEVWLSVADCNIFEIPLANGTFPVGGISVSSDPLGWITTPSFSPCWLDPGVYTVYLSVGGCAEAQITANVITIAIEEPDGLPVQAAVVGDSRFRINPSCFEWQYVHVDNERVAYHATQPIDGMVQPIPPASFNWTVSAGTLSNSTSEMPTYIPGNLPVPVAVTNVDLRLRAIPGSDMCMQTRTLEVYRDHLERDYQNWGTGIDCGAPTASVYYWTYQRYEEEWHLLHTWNCFGSVWHAFDGTHDGDAGDLPTAGFTVTVYDAPILWSTAVTNLHRGDIVSFYTYDSNTVTEVLQHAHTCMGSSSQMYGANNEPIYGVYARSDDFGHSASVWEGGSWRWWLTSSETYYNQVNTGYQYLHPGAGALLNRIKVHRRQ